MGHDTIATCTVYGYGPRVRCEGTGSGTLCACYRTHEKYLFHPFPMFSKHMLYIFIH